MVGERERPELCHSYAPFLLDQHMESSSCAVERIQDQHDERGNEALRMAWTVALDHDVRPVHDQGCCVGGKLERCGHESRPPRLLKQRHPRVVDLEQLVLLCRPFVITDLQQLFIAALHLRGSVWASIHHHHLWAARSQEPPLERGSFLLHVIQRPRDQEAANQAEGGRGGGGGGDLRYSLATCSFDSTLERNLRERGILVSACYVTVSACCRADRTSQLLVKVLDHDQIGNRADSHAVLHFTNTSSETADGITTSAG